MTAMSRLIALGCLLAAFIAVPHMERNGATGVTGHTVSLAAKQSPAAKKSARQATWEKQILKLTNQRRAAKGCRPLSAQKNLRAAARAHSSKMAARKTMSHQLPGEAGLATRVTKAGYKNWRGLAENVAYGYPTAKSMMAAWMASPGHRKNILNCKYKHLGVGVVLRSNVPWATQNFGYR